MPVPCAVLVNLGANNGRAARRWEDIAHEATRLLPAGSRIVAFHPGMDVVPEVKTLLDEGCTFFVSAGGDGSVNFLLNLLMRHTGEQARCLSLGGIGLGSSNDFIKPKLHFIKDLPTRLDGQHAALADVGKAEFVTPEGDRQTRYFIANASMGVTAEANWLFNHGDWFIRFSKDRWTNLAILYTAVRTILGFENFPASLRYDDQNLEVSLSNLAVLKSPYVSGSFHFDDPVQRNNGFFGLNLCLGMKKIELLRTLAGLAKGRFRGRPKTLSVATKSLSLHTPSPVALEMDGEVVQTREVHFSVIPEALTLLGL